MKKLLALVLFGGFILASCEMEQSSADSLISVDAKGNLVTDLEFDMEGCAGDTRDLIAGQHMVVGSVSVAVDGANYVITYNVTEPGYCLTEAHVDVADHPRYFAINNSGNPKIGNFDYVNDGVECTQEFSVSVPKTGTWLAVHGVVQCATSSPETIVANLPETADFCTGVQGPNSYLNINISEGPLSGDYEAWCIDNDQLININSCYEGASIYASTGSLPDGAYEYPENFDKVNWLLNQNIVGTESPNLLGTYTYGDLQFAIWYLLDDVENPDGSGYSLGPFSAERVVELLALAEANGDGFSPDCGDVVGVIVYLDGVQPLIIPFPLDCAPCDETVWAEGCGFPGSSWAMYFEYSDD